MAKVPEEVLQRDARRFAAGDAVPVLPQRADERITAIDPAPEKRFARLATSSMLGCVAAVIETESPSQERRPVSQRM
jgi:hypothetical protein